ncbi:hypothetical protein EUGRSUZ_D02020 [Eucalyptus grandis]|uniref:Uncharacterized protein n=2 Tax=Eucalyptus grandis TaxID=71139 RepID=A0ACC3L6W1_EUCGR|nr:hypothetical protein EUGRSUZ_D02020 [Eucalyptus grandis]
MAARLPIPMSFFAFYFCFGFYFIVYSFPLKSCVRNSTNCNFSFHIGSYIPCELTILLVTGFWIISI